MEPNPLELVNCTDFSALTKKGVGTMWLAKQISENFGCNNSIWWGNPYRSRPATTIDIATDHGLIEIDALGICRFTADMSTSDKQVKSTAVDREENVISSRIAEVHGY